MANSFRFGLGQVLLIRSLLLLASASSAGGDRSKPFEFPDAEQSGAHNRHKRSRRNPLTGIRAEPQNMAAADTRRS